MSATLKQKEINRLLVNTPSPAHADARSRLEEFVRVTAPYDLRHVQRAVSMILNAEVSDANPTYAIFPAMLVVVMRALLNKELEHEAGRRGAILQIQARELPFHQEPPELRKMAVAEGLARLIDPARPAVLTEAELAEKRAEEAQYLVRHDRFFHVDKSDDAIRRRLLKAK